MTWILTIGGREHYLKHGTDATPPNIEEIAHSLAIINRFTGHTSRPYSVAEHSLLVSRIAASEGASPVAQLAALLHDAHEAYIGDLASPVKWTIGHAWDELEHIQQITLQTELGIRAAMVAHRADIKRWDLIALATERRDLTSWDAAKHRPWPILDTPGQEVKPLSLHLDSPTRSATPWHIWSGLFIEKFDDLEREVRLSQGSAA